MYIGIDFEYHSRCNGYDLICACVTSEHGQTGEFWLLDDRDTDKLKRFIVKHKDDIFVAHALDLAESVCFRILGLEPCDYKFIDTFSLAKILGAKLTDTLKKRTKTYIDDDGEEYTKDLSKDKEKEYSLAACVRNRLYVDINCERKDAMRKLCINLDTAGHEQEIMDYCLDDTKYLAPLAKHMLKEYQCALDHSKPVGPCDEAPSALDVALDIGYVNNCCSEIAMRGFPLNYERTKHIRDKAATILINKKLEFANKYDGTYVYEGPKCDPQRKLVFKKARLLEHLAPILRKNNMKLPVTEKGTPSLDGKWVKAARAVDPIFEKYYQLMKLKSALQGCSNNWLDNYDEKDGRIYYQSLRPYTSNTFRCQPQPGKGFIPGWAKPLFCLLEPKEGKVLYEFDFKSEETDIQAELTGDVNYREVYTSGDMYLWTAYTIGQIPKAEYEEADKAYKAGDDTLYKALKAKYKANSIRDRAKRFWLGYSYGAGAETLSHQFGCSVDQADRFRQRMDRAFGQASMYKARWTAATLNPRGGQTHWRLPDNTVVRIVRKPGEIPGRPTVIGNWQFQAYGGVIIRKIIKWAHECRVPVIATVHDAIWVELDDDSKLQTRVQYIAKKMKQIADEVLHGDSMVVGSPDIVHHGDCWAPEKEYVDAFEQMMQM